MIKFLILVLSIINCSINRINASPKNIPTPSKENSNNLNYANMSTNLTIYRDRTIFNQVFPYTKNLPICVPSSIDPQSILLSGFPDIKDYHLKENELWIHAAAEFPCDITYSFSGLIWEMHYNIVINSDYKCIENFNAIIRLRNNNNVSFPHAYLRLVDAKTDNSLRTAVFREYTINTPQNLLANNTQSIPWLSLNDIIAIPDYRVYIGGEYLKEQQHSLDIPLQIWLSFENPLNIDRNLCQGPAIIYIRDKDKSIRFLGATQIDNTEAGKMISLGLPISLLGQFQSEHASPLSYIKSTLDQTEYKNLTEKIIETSYRLTIRNLIDKKISIKAVLDFGSDRIKIVRESQEHKVDPSSHQIYWLLEVDAKSEINVRYRLQLIKD